MDEKLYDVNEMLEKTVSNTEALWPNIARLQSGIIDLEQLFKDQLFEVAKASTLAVPVETLLMNTEIIKRNQVYLKRCVSFG